MDHQNIRGLRLHNQWISVPRKGQTRDVVGWLAASQAQDFAGAKWALGMRLQGTVETEIEKAYNAGEILRTHMLRPTWHFVLPEDVRWIQELTAERVHAANAPMYRKLELDEGFMKRVRAAFEAALRDGNSLTREELTGVLQRAGLEIERGQRMNYVMMRVELDCLICSGPRRGRQFTYALLDERAPQPRRMCREEGLVELSRRFFRSRGPATAHDYAKWSGMRLADARKGLEAVRGELEEADVEGVSYWWAGDEMPEARKGPEAHLLSIYDEYISGYRDRSAIAGREDGEKLIGKGAALYYIYLIDGRIRGTWRRTLGKEKVELVIEPFGDLSEGEREAVRQAAQRYGEFLGLRVGLDYQAR